MINRGRVRGRVTLAVTFTDRVTARVGLGIYAL